GAGGLQVEQRGRRRGGTPVGVTLTCWGLGGGDGGAVGVNANGRGRSGGEAAEDERRARHEAEVARTAAEAASRAKSEFLSAMSHEVRTPLSAVVGFAEILETLDLTPDRRRAALRHIGEAGNHIIALLDDVLDVAK